MSNLLVLARKAVPAPVPATALPDLGFPLVTLAGEAAPVPAPEPRAPRPPTTAPTAWSVPGCCPSCGAALPGLLIVTGERRFAVCPRCRRWTDARPAR